MPRLRRYFCFTALLNLMGIIYALGPPSAHAAGSISANIEGSFGQITASSGTKQMTASNPAWAARLIANGASQIQSGFLSFLFGGSTQTIIAAGQSATLQVNPTAGPVTVTIPADSLLPGTAITARVPIWVPSSGRPDFVIVPNTAVEILSANQPRIPVTFNFSYVNSDLTGFTPSRFLAARFDDNSGQWVTQFSTVDQSQKTVTSQIKHFSLFAIGQLTASDTVSTVRAAPNPFRPALGHTSVTIYNVPPLARIRIYTMTGRRVRDLTANAVGMASWDVKNENGQNVASGIYYGLAESRGAKKNFRVGVER